MKNEIVGNAPLPSDWIKDLKKTTVSQNNTTTTTQSKQTSTVSTQKTQNTQKVSDFSKRLSRLLENDPDIIKNAADISRRNYK
jgi:RNA:NAD 2'-phosphotransferase (TPT1/KptA family)